MFQTRAIQSFDIFHVFFHGIWKPCNEPETSGEWAHKCHKMAPFFILNIPLFAFSYPNFFRYLFVLTNFDSSRWYMHTTIPTTGTLILYAKMTSLDAIFCRRNKSSFRSHARFRRRKHKKIYHSHFVLMKKFELNL